MPDEKGNPTPSELLAKRPMPIFDVVHGKDNPGLKPERKAPPQPKESAVRNSGSSLVKDIVPAATLHSLQTLHWRLERAEARRKGKKS